MTKKIEFKFYIFSKEDGTFKSTYDMVIDGVFVTSDSAGLYSTPQYALYMAQNIVVYFVDMLNKIGTVPIDYSYSMGRIFINA